MKILFVGLETIGGIAERGRDDIVLDGFAETLSRLGHAVSPFYYDALLSDPQQLNDELLGRVEATRPDVIFFMTFQDEFKHETLRKLKDAYTTVAWFGDDIWRFDTYTARYVHDFTWCVTTDRFSLKKYHAMGQQNVLFSQWGAIDVYGPSAFDGYQYDVSFVGGKSVYRAWLVEELKTAGFDVHCFGHGWEESTISNQKMLSIFRSSKVNLNLPNGEAYDIRCLYSNVLPFSKRLELSIKLLFRRDYYLGKLQRSKSLNGLKARLYEVTYNGGFLLTDYSVGLEEFFRVGDEVALYTTVEDLKLQLAYYLQDDERRETIRRRGAERANPAYGYTPRLKEILDAVR